MLSKQLYYRSLLKRRTSVLGAMQWSHSARQMPSGSSPLARRFRTIVTACTQSTGRYTPGLEPRECVD